MKFLSFLLFLSFYKTSFCQRPTKTTDPFGYETITEIERIDTSDITVSLKGKLQFEKLKPYVLNNTKSGYCLQLVDQAKYLSTIQIDSLCRLLDTSVQRRMLLGINAMKKRALFLPSAYFSELTLTDSLFHQVKLSDFKGKYIFVDVWASWCEPCRNEMPHLKELTEKYLKNDLIVITISMDENKQKWLKAISDDSLPVNWKYYCDLLPYDDNKLYKDWGIMAIPYNFVIDKKGKLIDKQVSLKRLENILEKL